MVSVSQAATGNRIASLVSNVLNPFVTAGLALLALACDAFTDFGEVLKWSAIIIAVSMAPVVGGILFLVRIGRLDGLFASVRQQRTEVYVLTVVFTAIDYVILRYLNAPQIFIAALGTGLLGLIIFMAINFWWKISLHTAFASSLVTVLVIVCGWWGLAFSPLVLLIGWARVRLKEHTLAQVVTGALLSAGIGVIGFGLWGFV